MVPVMDAVFEQSSARPSQVVADKGYENGKSLAALESLGIVKEMTGQKKSRNYSYQAYVEQLSR